MSEGIVITLIGFVGAVFGAAIAGFAAIVAVGLKRKDESCISCGALGLLASLGAAGGLVLGAIFGTFLLLGIRVVQQPTPMIRSQATTVDVLANRGWQNTGVSIIRGNRVIIEHTSGLWFTGAADGGGHDASGGPNPWICSQPECHEPLHDFPKYALIGRIGESDVILKIGNRLDFIAEASGPLYLRPNYGDVDIAYFNPAGAIKVRITLP